MTNETEQQTDVGAPGSRDGEARQKNGEQPATLIQNMFLAALAALFAFVGGAGGSAVASMFEKTSWQRETEHAAKQELLAERIDLLERTVLSMNRIGYLGMYKAEGDYLLATSTLEIIADGEATPDFSDLVNGVVVLTEMEAEVTAVLTLNALYFGPKTRTAVKDLEEAMNETEHWWEVDEQSKKDLYAAMLDELSIGIVSESPSS